MKCLYSSSMDRLAADDESADAVVAPVVSFMVVVAQETPVRGP